MLFWAVAVVTGATGCLLLREAAHLSFTKARVLNVRDPGLFTSREMPGFVLQSADSPGLAAFRACLGTRVTGCGGLALAIELQHWVRSLQADLPELWRPPFGQHTEDPLRLLREMAEGKPGSCRRFAYLLTGALLSVGLDARIAVASADLDGRIAPHHCMVEVWIEDLGKWVLLDPTFDAALCVDGQPASLLEVYLALQKNEVDRVGILQNGTTASQPARAEYYRQAFKHIYLACTNALFDGYRVSLVGTRRMSFLHYVDVHSPEYPVRLKRFFLVGGVVALVLAILSLLYSLSAILV